MEASDTEEQMDIQMVEQTPTTPSIPKRRGKKSLVWEHFTIECAGSGCKRACCKLCKQTFAYSSGSKIAGTSHLKRHITLGSCPKLKNHDSKQLSLATGLKVEGDFSDPPKRRYRTVLNSLFDPDVSCEKLAKMIIFHEYPLHMVEQTAVIAFTQSLQPRFRMPTFDEIEAEVFSIYQKEKHKLMHIYSNMPGKISLTISLWTTSQSLGYVCLHGQFIDDDWKMHKRMLNFVMVTSAHSENALSEVIRICLLEWNMESKLFTITLDNNCSSHDIYSANLRDHLSNKNTLLLKGQLFVVRCYASILNVVAQDVLASIHGIIYNIRESVKFVRTSPNREEKFSEIGLQLEIRSTKSLSLDISTCWDTTYHMLTAALDYKQAFTVLETCDDHYNEAPSHEDWKKVEIVCMYLKLLHDSAVVISEASEPTSNIFFKEAWKIEMELSHGVASEDAVVSSIAAEMHEKFDKYWKDCSLVLAIAVVMDPRFKMKLVEFSYSKLYGEEASKYVEVVKDALHELYRYYISEVVEVHDAAKDNNGVNNGDASDALVDFDQYISKTAANENKKPELEQYLEEGVSPRLPEFDVLNWWKLNTIKYPKLSRMARDVLAIPMSMASGGSSIFSMGVCSRVLDDYRSSLQPETVEALFCTKDWLQYMPMNDPLPALDALKMVF